jgi:hypothetical protein
MNGVGTGMVEPSGVFYRMVMAFLPNLFVALLLFVAGLILAKLLGFIFLRVFRVLKVDRFWNRAGIREVLARGGVKRPISVELSRLVSWLTILIFIVIALSALHIPFIETVLARTLLYLPNVFAAILILLAGVLLGNFFSRAILIALVNSGIREAGLIARITRVAILVFAVTMALEQLDIGKISVLIAFAIIFGGAVLAFALAFGFAVQPYVKAYLEKRMEEAGRQEGDGEKGDRIDHL